MASQITSLTILYSKAIKENIKAPRHWWIPYTKGNVSIWWRHHVGLDTDNGTAYDNLSAREHTWKYIGNGLHEITDNR